MGWNKMKLKRTGSTTALFLLAAVFLSGCSTHFFGPERAKADTFFEKVQRHCGTRSIGGQTVSSMFAMNSNEQLVISWTSDLSTGRISKEKYKKIINGYYQTSDNDAAIDCILRQLGHKGSGAKGVPFRIK
jgi:hypothetical protein